MALKIEGIFPAVPLPQNKVCAFIWALDYLKDIEKSGMKRHKLGKRSQMKKKDILLA